MMRMVYQETKWKHSTWFHYLEKYVYSHVADKVQFHAVVKEVLYGETGPAKVVMEDGSELEADKVICTIPIGVLKTSRVRFEPPLPEKMREAIEAVHMPPGFRILFEMKEKFYPDLTSAATFCDQLCRQDELTFIYDPLLGKELSGKQHILAYVAIGETEAGTLGRLSDDDLAKQTLAKIDELFEGQGSRNYVKHIVQNWTLEPHILGSYTEPVADHHRQELGKTLNNKLIFAGEHTSLKLHSLVPGAAMEGRRAAVEAATGRII
jgi:monoamine oxidase